MKAVYLFFLGCTKEYDFYLSPKDNNNNPITLEAPFSTLDKARLAVRELKSSKKEITVDLKDGK